MAIIGKEPKRNQDADVVCLAARKSTGRGTPLITPSTTILVSTSP